MKLKLEEKSDRELEKDFPIKGMTPGWFFSITEISNGYWRVEGSDKWGRKISLDGVDPDDLLEKAEAEAMRINE
jgi:hypothetical protein